MNQVRNIVFYTILAVAIAGCGVRTKKIYVRVPCEVTEKAAAEKHFKIGKLYYEECRFHNSIEHLSKSLASETSDMGKARCYLYLGANYFYLRNMDAARYYFGQAKKRHSPARPSPYEFAPEIIQFFNSTR